MLIRRALCVFAGLVLGAVIGGSIGVLTLPTHERMRRFARDLVPPEAIAVGVSEIGGFEPFVGRYEAVARFRTDEHFSEFVRTVRDSAIASGWTPVDTEVAGGGEVQRWTRQEVAASIYLFDRQTSASDDGMIYVHYAEATAGRFLAAVALGAGLGLFLGLLVAPLVARREGSGPVPKEEEGL